jgi:hypothetical protein
MSLQRRLAKSACPSNRFDARRETPWTLRSSITTEDAMPYTAIDNLPPVHPGEILKDELEALNMSARKFAEHIRVPPTLSQPS